MKKICHTFNVKDALNHVSIQEKDQGYKKHKDSSMQIERQNENFCNEL